jgi:hypothetical protein
MNYNQIGMYKRPMNLIEKLACGWWWFGEGVLEWIWCMTHPEDDGGDFFCHICSDYVAYEEETYYNGK